jgi:5'(3')-deoxyribonucleotidase
MKKTLYIDMDNVLVDFPSGMAACDPSLLKQYEGHPDEIPGLFGLMQPMPGAIAAYNELSELFDTYILSTAPWKNPSAWSDKLEWVKRHLGAPAYKRLTLSHNKHLSRGHYLVDDRPNNGAEEFGDVPGQEWIHFGHEQFPSWAEVVAYLKENAAHSNQEHEVTR